MRNKKGSMELSVNSIVILVIAIVIMGLILGFIRTKFAEVGGNLVTNEPDPTPASVEEPITLSRETISTVLGGKAVLKVNVYNTLGTPLSDAYINLDCQGVAVSSTKLAVSSGYKTIADSDMASFIVTISPVKTSGISKGSYLCTVGLWQGTSVQNIPQRDIVIMIN